MDSLEKRNEFLSNPYQYYKANKEWDRARIISHPERIVEKNVSHSGYDVVELMKGNLIKGQQYMKLEYKGKVYQFSNFDNQKKFYE